MLDEESHDDVIAQLKDEPMAALETALAAALPAEAVEAKLRAAQKDGKFAGLPARATHEELVYAAVRMGILSVQEEMQLKRFERLRAEVVKVDDFAQDFGRSAIASEMTSDAGTAALQAAPESPDTKTTPPQRAAA